MCYDTITCVAPFATKETLCGFVAVSGYKNGKKGYGTIRFLLPLKFNGTFSQKILKLKYSPRNILIHPDSKMIILCETEKKLIYDCNSNEQRTTKLESCTEPKKWFTRISVVNAWKMELEYYTELENGESAISTTMLSDTSTSEKNNFFIVGSAINLQSCPKKADLYFIRVYDYDTNSHELKLLSKTRVEDLPTVITPFNGCLLAGIASTVRLYKIGKKRILRKAEYKGIPNLIVTIGHIKKRIYVSDVQESVFILKYRPKSNDMYMIAEDYTKRFVTSMCLIDYDTIALGDKFGNLSILRLPRDLSQQAEDDLIIRKGDESKNQCFKVRVECTFYIGDIVSSIIKTKFFTGGDEVLIYSTIGGSISVLIPLTFKENFEFFQDLEMHMRQEAPPLLGMDHIAYRSYYFPCRHIIDGDLCEMFTTLKRNLQDAISMSLDKKPEDIMKNIEEMRNKIS